MSLPVAWAQAPLRDLARVITKGTTPTTLGFAYQRSGIAFVKVENLANGQIDPATISDFINEEAHAKLSRSQLKARDVLVSIAGTIGRIATVKAENLPANTNQAVGIIRGIDQIFDSKYLRYFFESPQSQSQLQPAARGGAMNNISLTDLGNVETLIAPLAEQDRIVAEIEKQFTRLDDAVAALKRVQTNLKRYRASVLKAACEGRLVPTDAELACKEGRTYEPASELLKRILSERRAKWQADQLQKMIAAGKPPKDDEWKKKYKEPGAPEAADLPSLPEGWVWATLEQVSHLIRNGISTKPGQEKGLPILRISAVRPLSVDLDDVRFLTPSDEFREFKLCENDLLFTRYNGNREYVGVCGRVKRPPGGLVHPDKLIRVVPIRAALAPWVEIVSNVGFPRAFLNKRIRTTAGQSGVSGEDLKQLPIPLCPESEAMRIATEVDRALTTIQAIGRSFQANITRATQTRNSILHNAFSGKLVPQDPNDEPASVLLERIRAERAALATNNGNQKARPEAGTANAQRHRRVARLAHRVSGGKGVRE